MLFLGACGGPEETLSGVAAAPGVLVLPPTRPADPIRLQYVLGKPARVSVRVEGPEGGYVLRDGQAREAGAHFVLFNGVVPTGARPEVGGEAAQVARVLSNGSYRFTVRAEPADGSAPAETGGAFEITGAQPEPPSLVNLQVEPRTISPNQDAVDDVTQITFRLPQTNTAAVLVQGVDGTVVPVLAPEIVPAGEQGVVFNGRDLYGRLLPDGNYTATVRVQDRLGSTLEASRPITIEGAGEPDVALLAVEITPPALMLGGDLHIRFTVKNTGRVPLRTQGPDSGYRYTTNDSYSSIEGGKYDQQAGLWRVGADWEGNAGGAPFRYPFRWGFGKTLQPGETVTVDGYIAVLKREQTMWFFGGVIAEEVRIWLDRLGRTPVRVSW